MISICLPILTRSRHGLTERHNFSLLDDANQSSRKLKKKKTDPFGHIYNGADVHSLSAVTLLLLARSGPALNS